MFTASMQANLYNF